MSNQKNVFSANLKRLMDSKGIDQRRLSEEMDLSEMAVSHWVNGVKYPRMGNIQKIADYFGVMKSDLLEEKGEAITFTNSSYNYLPTTISAGLPLTVDAITQAPTIQIPDDLMGRYAGGKDIFVTRVSGDSMDKIIPDGSLISVKPISIESLCNGDIVVFSENHDYSVKYYYKQGDKIIFKPSSNNAAHFDQVFNVDDNINIHGKVVMYIVNLD